MDLTRIDTIVQFSQGTSTWSNINVPVPAGVVVIDTDNKVIKEGDGATLFASLPVCLDYNFHSSTSGAVEPVGDDIGFLVTADDSMYSVGSTKLTDILTSITSKATTDVTQDTRITNLTNQLGIIEVIAEGVVDGTIVVCSNGQYIPGDRTLAQLIADLVAQANVAETGMHVDDLEWYTDSGLTNKVIKPNQVTEQNTYWCKITGFHDNAELKNVDFGLATTNSNVTITNSKKEITSALIAAVYGGTADDQFSSITVDSLNNIICVGVTSSEGFGSFDALVVKFDKNLNVIARKRYGGTGEDRFHSIIVDSNDNIFCAGYTKSEGSGSPTYTNALIVKFSSALTIVARKVYGGAGEDVFYNVTVDASDNVFVCGGTTSEGLGNWDALVVKFDNSLNIVARKRYGGSSGDVFYDITADISGNIFACGETGSEGSGSNDALVVKFDNALNIVARKRYGGTAADLFYGIGDDTNGNVICVGWTASEGTATEALVIKFDNSLNIVARKRYGGSGGDYFRNVNLDSQNNIICCGYTLSEGLGSNDALIVKFDSSLSITKAKRYGGTGGEGFANITTDSNNNIILAGWATSEGAGNIDGLVVKLPPSIPTGTIVGTILTGLTLADVTTLTLADSSLTLADSTLTLADSALTLTDSTLTLTTSTLTLEKDILVAGRYTNPTELITTIYSSAFVDEFKATAIDSSDNIFAVGLTTISGVQHALIVKLNSSFNTLVRKLYTGQYSDNFNSVAIDSSNNVIAVGKYTTASGGFTEAFIVKFSNDLSSVISHKTYGANGDDVFNDITVGASDNYYVCGYTTSEGQGLKEGLVVKFNSSLAILYKKRYGGTGNDVLNGITMDAVGNAICVGSTSSEGSNTSGLILKLDTNLNIVLRKYYNSTLGTTTEFNAVITTAANISYCVGRVVMASGNKGLIVKYDSSLNITGNKLYGNTVGSTEFTGVGLDSTGNVFVAGKTNAEGAGNFDALIMKFDSALAIKGRKTYGTIGEDADIDCTILDDDVVLSGYSVIKGSTDAVITKLPNGLPAGTYTNKYFTDLILSDSKLILSDDNGTGVSSTLAMSDSALVLTNGTMTLENAPGAVVRDVTIMDAISNVFKVQIGNVVGAEEFVSVPFTVTTNDGDETLSKTISVDTVPFSMIMAVYGGTSDESGLYWSKAVDSNDNIFVCGGTTSEGPVSTGLGSALIIKFDNSLNIVAKKIYSGNYQGRFIAVVVDSNDNVFAVGENCSDVNNAFSEGLIVKFDNNLNVLSSKRYGVTYAAGFYSVGVDSSNNIFCGGYSYEGYVGNGGSFQQANALIVKFDNNLNKLADKYYNSGVLFSVFTQIATDSNGNVFACGYEDNSSGNQNCIVFKFNNSLNLLVKKSYKGAKYNNFYAGLFVDADNNVLCIGSVNAGLNASYGLIVKFDNDLKIIKSKKYGPSIVFISSAINSVGEICCGLVRISKDLESVIYRKFSGGLGPHCTIVDSQDNVFNGGNLKLATIGGSDIVIIKLPADVKSGTFGGSLLIDYVMSDITVPTVSDCNTLTLFDNESVGYNGTLLVANSNLTLSDSNLTLKRELVTT